MVHKFQHLVHSSHLTVVVKIFAPFSKHAFGASLQRQTETHAPHLEPSLRNRAFRAIGCVNGLIPFHHWWSTKTTSNANHAHNCATCPVQWCEDCVDFCRFCRQGGIRNMLTWSTSHSFRPHVQHGRCCAVYVPVVPRRIAPLLVLTENIEQTPREWLDPHVVTLCGWTLVMPALRNLVFRVAAAAAAALTRAFGSVHISSLPTLFNFAQHANCCCICACGCASHVVHCACNILVIPEKTKL